MPLFRQRLGTSLYLNIVDRFYVVNLRTESNDPDSGITIKKLSNLVNTF